MRFLLPAGFVLASGIAVAQPPAPTPGDVAQLVKQLGSDEFSERERAAKGLAELGSAAVDALRVGVKSDNPETRLRAGELLQRAELRLANEKALAPTLVQLDCKDTRLDDVLAELSRQAKWDVVVGGPNPEHLAGRKVTVSTSGRVPLWEAVLKVCDATDTHVACAFGMYAPGSQPSDFDPSRLPPSWIERIPVLRSPVPPPPPGPVAPSIPDLPPLPEPPGPVRPAPKQPEGKYRRAANPDACVLLEPRTGPRRPAAVYGAVLVEAVEVPTGTKTAQPSALLLIRHEPGRLWMSTSDVKVSHATDANGRARSGRYVKPAGTAFGSNGDLVAVHGFDGVSRMVEDPDGVYRLPTPYRYFPLVKFDGGPKATNVIRELDVSVLARVRGGYEPLSRATLPGPNQTVAGKGSDVAMSASYRGSVAAGNLTVTVEAAYERFTVAPADENTSFPGDGPYKFFAWVRVTDADGKPYTLRFSAAHPTPSIGDKWVTQKVSIELYPDKDGHGPPAEVTFWGLYCRPLEVPVRLKDVVLSGGN